MAKESEAEQLRVKGEKIIKPSLVMTAEEGESGWHERFSCHSRLQWLGNNVMDRHERLPALYLCLRDIP